MDAVAVKTWNFYIFVIVETSNFHASYKYLYSSKLEISMPAINILYLFIAYQPSPTV